MKRFTIFRSAAGALRSLPISFGSRSSDILFVQSTSCKSYTASAAAFSVDTAVSWHEPQPRACKTFRAASRAGAGEGSPAPIAARPQSATTLCATREGSPKRRECLLPLEDEVVGASAVRVSADGERPSAQRRGDDRPTRV